MRAAIRLAEAGEEIAVAECVRAAYATYIPRIGTPPAPMLTDYEALIAAREVYVIHAGPSVKGVLVVRPINDSLFIENVAVCPQYQGQGLGRTLLAFAEELACNMGLDSIQLYTNELMTENIALYLRLGYEEIDRRVEDGFRRVFMRKALR